MMRTKSLYKVVPSLITYTGLASAFAAVVLALHDMLPLSGVCIIVGYVLDGADGAVARRLDVASAFGLQLDSLVDVVAFGVAPSVLVYQHLRSLVVNPVVGWVVCVVYLIGGTFRLARFNLLPAKTSHSESVGLTISTSGATLALGVLVNDAYGQRSMSVPAILALVAVLTFLMVSRVRYPALASMLRRRRLSVTLLGTAAVLAVWLSPQLIALGLTGGYVSFGLIRAIYDML